MHALKRAARLAAGALGLAAAAATGAGVPAPGGEPLLGAAETAPATLLGRIEGPAPVDRHGWAAHVRVERALVGEFAPGSRVRIAWEELSRGRPARFSDGDRVLVALVPLPGASLWRKRFPERDARAVAAEGDAFLRAPDAASVETLSAFLGLPAEERVRPTGVEALAGLVARGQPPLARAALQRLGEVPDLDARISPAARDRLVGTLSDPARPRELGRALLGLAGERRLQTLRSGIAPHAREGSPLRAEAIVALASLDGGMPSARVAELLGSGDPAVRAVGARFAAGTPAERSLPRRLREDPDPRVRTAALRTLLAARGEEAIGAVGAALFDADEGVRQAAVLGLAALGPAAVPELEQLALRREVEEARVPMAALSLAGPAGRKALERIAAAHEDERVRAVARVFLGRPARPRH